MKHRKLNMMVYSYLGDNVEHFDVHFISHYPILRPADEKFSNVDDINVHLGVNVYKKERITHSCKGITYLSIVGESGVRRPG